MATVPSNSSMTGAAVTEANFKQRLIDILDYMRGALNDVTNAGLSATQAAADADRAEAALVQFNNPNINSIVPAGSVVNARILSDGWTLEVDVSSFPIGTTYDPSKIDLFITSMGFDANGNAVQVPRRLKATKLVRQPFPNQASDQVSVAGSLLTAKFALDDYVYIKDRNGNGNSGRDPIIFFHAGWAINTVPTNAQAGAFTAANESTVSYPTVFGKWSMPPLQRFGATAHLEVVAANAYARNSSMVAAVKFELTGRTSAATVSSTVTSMSVSAWRTDANPVQVYQTDLSTTTLTQDEIADARAIIYPFIGDTPLDSDATAYPDASVICSTPNIIDHAGTYGTAYAYVNATTGSDATGVSSATAATAAASPYLTINGALTGIHAFNLATYGRNNIGGGEVRLMAGTHPSMGGNASTRTAGDTWCTITRDPATTKALAIIGDPASNANAYAPGGLALAGITVQTTGAVIVLRGLETTATATPVKQLWIDDCTLTPGAVGRMFHQFYNVYFTQINCTTSVSGTFAHFSSGLFAPLLMRGITATTNVGICESRTMIGCSPNLGSANALADVNTSGGQPHNDGSIIAYNSFYNVAFTPINYAQSQGVNLGLAVFGNLFESINATYPIAAISANAYTAINDVLFFGNTCAGARVNMFYNDAAGQNGVKIKLFLRGNVYDSWWTKHDTFALDGNNIGAWSVLYNVGSRSEAQGAVADTGRGSFRGEVAPYGSVYGIANPWTLNASAGENIIGNGLGGGNYTPVAASSIANVVRSGEAFMPFDLSGNVRANDGTGAAGAYEAP